MLRDYIRRDNILLYIYISERDMPIAIIAKKEKKSYLTRKIETVASFKTS